MSHFLLYCPALCDIIYLLSNSLSLSLSLSLCISLYGAEWWGNEDCRMIESVHFRALKSFLAVSLRTPNGMVYGDTSRYPLYINAKLRSV